MTVEQPLRPIVGVQEAERKLDEQDPVGGPTGPVCDDSGAPPEEDDAGAAEESWPQSGFGSFP
jgi:hypothetical protein